MGVVFVVLGDSEASGEFVLGIFDILDDAECATFDVGYDSKWIETCSVGPGSKHQTRTVHLDSLHRQVPHEFAWPVRNQKLPPVGTVLRREVSTREVDMSETAYSFDKDSAYWTVRAGNSPEEAAARLEAAWEESVCLGS